MAPESLIAMSVWQQSQINSSMSCSLVTVESAAIDAPRNVMPVATGSSVTSLTILRPSSQTSPVALSSANIDTKPCSVGVPSSCGRIGSDQLAPPSADCTNTTSYAYVKSADFSSQWADSLPLPIGCTDGMSAQLTNMSMPLAIVDGADQAPLSRRE